MYEYQILVVICMNFHEFSGTLPIPNKPSCRIAELHGSNTTEPAEAIPAVERGELYAA
jgi:hypothetical protein